MVGLLGTARVTTIHRTEERMKHSSSSVDATSMAPFIPTASEQPFMGAKKYPPLVNLQFIPALKTVMYHGVPKGEWNKILNFGSLPETRRGIVTWVGQDLWNEYWSIPVFWNKTNPQNIWFWKVKIDSYMALVSSLGESWCCSTQNYPKKCSRDVTVLPIES